jgi:hypothetical protein
MRVPGVTGVHIRVWVASGPPMDYEFAGYPARVLVDSRGDLRIRLKWRTAVFHPSYEWTGYQVTRLLEA